MASAFKLVAYRHGIDAGHLVWECCAFNGTIVLLGAAPDAVECPADLTLHDCGRKPVKRIHARVLPQQLSRNREERVLGELVPARGVCKLKSGCFHGTCRPDI